MSIDHKKSKENATPVLKDSGKTKAIRVSSLNKAEQQIFNNLQESFKQIKLHQEGKFDLKDAKALLSEL